jgi:hypothetical protein
VIIFIYSNYFSKIMLFKIVQIHRFCNPEFLNNYIHWTYQQKISCTLPKGTFSPKVFVIIPLSINFGPNLGSPTLIIFKLSVVLLRFLFREETSDANLLAWFVQNRVSLFRFKQKYAKRCENEVKRCENKL